ncbi:MAG: GTPase HflX [Firmicutes bacterium]|nr:GTPase HflX [Bacillota bacterium]
MINEENVSLHSTEELKERVILVGVDKGSGDMEEEACLEELAQLADTAGAEVVGQLIQKRDSFNGAHYVGKGKIEEIKYMIDAFDATGIICDDELSPNQLKNLEKLLDTKVMDRTMLILDIFAGRAVSREGKIQVELAQLKYRLSRLAGIGTSLSRLGGGIGTRGPGEKKLETDRRYIKERISELKKDLKDAQAHRELLRNRRKKNFACLSLIGYTNAGKSTILNTLTDAGVLAEDKLFATLDPTTRLVKLPAGTEILLTDTVGFIQKLPHQLIEAFKATLEELVFADYLIHVVDASNPHRDEQMEVVYKTIRDLKCEHIPVITVFNKCDLEVALPLPRDKNAEAQVTACGKNKAGLEDLLVKAEEIIKASKKVRKILIPYTEGNLVAMIHKKCEMISEEHTGGGTLIEAYLDEEMENRLSKYFTE